MKREFDVKTPQLAEIHGKNVHELCMFLESEHKNMKLTYDTLEEAKRYYHSFYEYLARRILLGDVKIMRRQNVVFVEKVGADDEQ